MRPGLLRGSWVKSARKTCSFLRGAGGHGALASDAMLLESPGRRYSCQGPPCLHGGSEPSCRIPRLPEGRVPAFLPGNLERGGGNKKHSGSPQWLRQLWDELHWGPRPKTSCPGDRGEDQPAPASRERRPTKHEWRDAVHQSGSARHWLCDVVRGLCFLICKMGVTIRIVQGRSED